MCAKLRTQILLLSAVLGTGIQQLQAQSTSGPRALRENSPYSRFGMGDFSTHSNAIIRGMGGTATAYIDNFTINNFNPASYSFLKVTTLDFAIEGRTKTVVMGDRSTNSGTGTLSYLSLGVPLGKYAGMSFGLKPVTSMYYNAGDTVQDPIMGRSLRQFNGNGTTQMVYLGVSGKVGGFSLGVNGGYIFGNSYNSSTLGSGTDSTRTYSSQFDRSQRMGGLYWKAGALYNFKFKKDKYLNLGATFALSQTLNATANENSINSLFDNLSGSYIYYDTVIKNDFKGDFVLPAEYSFGVHAGKTFNWDIGADFVYTDWTQFSNMGNRLNVADNAWRASVGGEVIPDPSSKKMLSNTTYRIGGYYGKDYLVVNATNLTYLGVTIGASLPLKRTYTQFGRLNAALDVGRRGVLTDGLARETFVKFTVGVSFNDIWFKKRKFD